MVVEQKDILQFLSENREFFRSTYNVTKIGIFGSYARNNQNETSDIDVVVDFAMPVDLFEAKNSLREIISNRFQKTVDICRLKYVNNYAKTKIEREAIYV